MKIQCKNPGAQAATLAEIVIAIALVTISAAGLMSALGYGFALTQSLRENQRATQILLEKAETLRLYNWDQVNSNGFIPSSFTAVYDPQATGSASAGITYDGTVALDPFPGGYDYHTNMRLVTITVSWTTLSRPQTRTLVTSIARDGEQNYVW